MQVYISYGWPEGPAHGRRLGRALRAAGYGTTGKIQDADVVIAHSAGCFMLDKAVHARVVLLVGLPYWPGRRLAACTFAKIRIERKNAGWLVKSLFHAYYLVAHFGRWLHMVAALRHWHAARSQYENPAPAVETYGRSSLLPLAANVRRVILVRNAADTYLEPNAARQLAKREGWQIKNMPGEHDDIWANPLPYVALVERKI